SMPTPSSTSRPPWASGTPPSTAADPPEPRDPKGTSEPMSSTFLAFLLGPEGAATFASRRSARGADGVIRSGKCEWCPRFFGPPARPGNVAVWLRHSRTHHYPLPGFSRDPRRRVPVVHSPIPMARTPRFSVAGRICVPLTMLMVTFAAAAPAGARTATSERKQRDQVRAKQADLARKIDALKASDDDLDRAVQALEAQVRSQQARVTSARQAVAAADSQRQVAEQRLQQTQADMASTRSSLVARAIEAYVQPQDSTTSEQLVVSGVVDLGEMSRR